MAPPFTVAIIGAGPQGLAALKNILEESRAGAVFQPTLFEARDRVGGLWAYSDDPAVTTVLRSTLGNVSRYRNCYGDFPVLDEDGGWDQTGTYQGQKGFLRYLERYVRAFGLEKYMTFGRQVVGLTRLQDRGKWEVVVKREGERTGDKEETCLFDKVIVATGQYCLPVVPVVEGMDIFKGLAIHSNKFKRASDFAGKKVLISGFGNTAADISTELAECAETVILSHRNGNYIFPRINKGKPLDLFTNRRRNKLRNTMEALAPVYAQALTDNMAGKMSSSAFSFRPEWRFQPAPPLLLASPIISDTLVDCLAKGTILSATGLRRVVSESTVELDDGSRLEIDDVIFCTGYKGDFSLMPGVEFEDQKSLSDPSQDALPEPLVPRLYQNIFSPAHADSLAFLNNWKLGSGICEVADLMSMAITQTWKGAFRLPSEQQMNREIDAHRSWCRTVVGGKAASPKLVDEGRWRAWLHEAAGTGVNDYLGYGLQGWWYWMRNPAFCSVLMTGVDSPHLARLFDGRRKTWDGARDAILRDNEDVDRRFGKISDVKKKQ